MQLLVVAAQELYWCDGGLAKIEKANLDGSDREVVYERGGLLIGLALDADYLYVTVWYTA